MCLFHSRRAWNSKREIERVTLMKTQDLGIVCFMLVIALGIWRITDGKTARISKEATVSAYVEANKIMGEASSIIDSIMEDGKLSPHDEALKHASICRTSANNIRAIDTYRVDPKVSDLILFYADYFELTEAFFADVQRLYEAIAEYDNSYNTGGAFLEAFLRGAMGDPFGKAKENIAAVNNLRSLGEKNQSLMQRCIAEGNKLRQMDARVRTYLESQYNIKVKIK